MAKLKWLPAVLTVGVLALYAPWLAEPINLTVTDLGRHLKNGQLVWQHREVLSTNFYSYTEPEHPFVNHHWASGVIFFLIWKLSGLTGLHLFFIALSLIAFGLMVRCAQERAGVGLAALLSLLVIPLLSSRAEVRPEVFSMLFTAVLFHRLTRLRERTPSWRSLWWVPVMEAAWVNLHSYFVLGPALIAAFLLDSLCLPQRRGDVRPLAAVFGLTVLATLCNPFGVRGALVPFTMFQEYGYRLFENQSIPFLLARFHLPRLWLFIGTSVVLGASLGAAWYRVGRSVGMAETLIAFGISAMAWSAYRNLALFGLLALPLIAGWLGAIWTRRARHDHRLALGAALGLALAVAVPSTVWSPPRASERGVGLQIGDSAAADFIRRHRLEGPLFNNYDIGGYLIFHLFPAHRVFVDNRPEAYSASFFHDVYVPMQEDEAIWQRVDARFGLNLIVFHRNDLTPWGQQFLIARIDDPAWAAVFVDRDTLIFLKRHERNQSVIERFEIPRSAFHVRSAQNP